MDLESLKQRVSLLAGITVPRRTPMLHEAWVHACSEGLDPEGRFEVFSVGETTRPTAGAAFVRRRDGRGDRLSLLGAEELWEPSDVWYVDAEAAASLASLVVDRRLPLHFGHFPADSPFLTALKKAAGRRALVVTHAVSGSPYIVLDESWRVPEKKFSSRKQRDLRRKRRKAEAVGPVAFEVVAPGGDDAAELLDEAMAVEAASWKARSRTALAFDATLRSFFRAYVRMAGDAGVLRFAFLRIGGRAIAVQVGVESDGACWQLKIGYDEAFRDCSPGALLMLELVRHASEQNLSTFEFLGKTAPWTREWTDLERPSVRLRVYPYNAAGLGALASDAGRVIARRVRARRGARASASAHEQLTEEV